MERVAPAVRQSQHLLAAAQELGRDRRAAQALAGLFVPAKKGGPKLAPPSGARARSGWFWSMARGPPLGAYLDAASPAEVTFLEQTLDTVAVGRPGKPGRPRKRPDRLIAGKRS